MLNTQRKQIYAFENTKYHKKLKPIAIMPIHVNQLYPVYMSKIKQIATLLSGNGYIDQTHHHIID